VESKQIAGCALIAVSLCGCRAFTEQYSFSVAADPLCEETPGYSVGPGGICNSNPPAYPVMPPTGNPATPKKDYLGLVVNESEFACGKFVNGLVLSETGVDTGLDLLTTVFTALGTAFTPLATVHALTAAGSISSGWKTAIDADIYAKASIANYAQAIQGSYYADVKSYLDNLTKSDETALVPSVEVAKIRSIHKECSLASAQATIATTLQPSTPSAPAAAPQPAANAAAPPPPPGAVTTQAVVPGHPIGR